MRVYTFDITFSTLEPLEMERRDMSIVAGLRNRSRNLYVSE